MASGWRIGVPALCAALLVSGVGALADDDAPAPDKSGYSLFDPVPDDQLRALASDRPGKSQNPLTLDAGRFQIESDIVNYTFEREAGQSTRTLVVAAPVLKLGLTDWAELELGMVLHEESHAPGAVASGFGDMTLGIKANLAGNAGGAWALALIPTLKLPTADAGLGNGSFEATVGAPLAVQLPADWSLTVEPGIGILRNGANSGYHAAFTGSVGVSHALFSDDLTGSLEFFGFVGTDRGEAAYATFDPSLAWMVSPDLQLDLGVYIGLNDAAPDWNPYCGITWRW